MSKRVRIFCELKHPLGEVVLVFPNAKVLYIDPEGRIVSNRKDYDPEDMIRCLISGGCYKELIVPPKGLP